MVTARGLQISKHSPHPMHASRVIWCCLPGSPAMQCVGQTGTQSPHPVQAVPMNAVGRTGTRSTKAWVWQMWAQIPQERQALKAITGRLFENEIA